MKLSSAINKLGFEKVDFLQVDAEGFDDKIILSLDLKTYRPIAISYEYVHINGIAYKKLVDYLIKNKYKIVRWRKTDEIAIDASL